MGISFYGLFSLRKKWNYSNLIWFGVSQSGKWQSNFLNKKGKEKTHANATKLIIYNYHNLCENISFLYMTIKNDVRTYGQMYYKNSSAV